MKQQDEDFPDKLLFFFQYCQQIISLTTVSVVLKQSLDSYLVFNLTAVLCIFTFSAFIKEKKKENQDCKEKIKQYYSAWKTNYLQRAAKTSNRAIPKIWFHPKIIF